MGHYFVPLSQLLSEFRPDPFLVVSSLNVGSPKNGKRSSDLFLSSKGEQKGIGKAAPDLLFTYRQVWFRTVPMQVLLWLQNSPCFLQRKPKGHGRKTCPTQKKQHH